MHKHEYLAGILWLSDKYSLYYSTSKILYIPTFKANGHENKINQRIHQCLVELISKNITSQKQNLFIYLHCEKSFLEKIIIVNSSPKY